MIPSLSFVSNVFMWISLINFSVLRNFIVFFLRIPIFLRTFAPISNVEFKSERNMEEKKYHIEESKIAGDKVCEPSPAYRSAASSASSVSLDETYDTDSYPMGRSLEQVMEHCSEIDKHLDDPNYGHPVDDLIARLEQKIAQWR